MYDLPDLCESCKESPAVERHHKDDNPLNNDPSNLLFVCRKCHMRLDGRISDTPGVHFHRNRWQVQIKVGKERHYLGRYQTKEEAVQVATEFRRDCIDPLLKAS